MFKKKSPCFFLQVLCVFYVTPVFAVIPSDISKSAEHTIHNGIGPRLQWEANYGYCGEVSIISAGLNYGQYVSQYDARQIANDNHGQSEEDNQLLLGVNDTFAAKRMHLNFIEWKNNSELDAHNFLTWVKNNVASGYPVIIGVYENYSIFNESITDSDVGQKEYDHIVPVLGISSKHPLSRSNDNSYYDSDVLIFSDNGLYTRLNMPDDYIYKISFSNIQANRRQANKKSAPVYTLRRDGGNFGLAITGVKDLDGQTMPVRITTNRNYESPVMRQGSDIRPIAKKLTLTVVVSQLNPGVSYTLYRYNDFKSVPEQSFNAKASDAIKSWKINIKSGSTYTIKEDIYSNQTAIYRAVPSSAP